MQRCSHNWADREPNLLLLHAPENVKGARGGKLSSRVLRVLVQVLMGLFWFLLSLRKTSWWLCRRKYSERFSNAFFCYMEIETSAHFLLAEVKIPQGTRSLNRWALTWLFRGVSFHCFVGLHVFGSGAESISWKAVLINPHVLHLFLLLVGSISLFEFCWLSQHCYFVKRELI